jgi:F-type H+-transporting ATPase subunit epsilon
MLPDQFELEVATPERLLVRAQCTEAQIPGERGYLGILPGHSPVLGQLGVGELSYATEGQRRYLVVQGGFFEVTGDRVRVLADTAEHAADIDVKRAESSLKRASERLSRPDIGVDVARALNAMKRAEARLAAAKR